MITVGTHDSKTFIYSEADDFVVDDKSGFLAVYKGTESIAAHATWAWVQKDNSETADPA